VDAEVEQAAFNPAHLVPGIGSSPDKMLHGKLFSHGDTHRYRLGVNHMHLPVNRPHAAEVGYYSRDGAMRSDGNYGARKTMRPIALMVRDKPENRCGHEVKSPGSPEIMRLHIIATNNDFVQAGDLYRRMKKLKRRD
jgi:catalase